MPTLHYSSVQRATQCKNSSKDLASSILNLSFISVVIEPRYRRIQRTCLRSAKENKQVFSERRRWLLPSPLPSNMMKETFVSISNRGERFSFRTSDLKYKFYRMEESKKRFSLTVGFWTERANVSPTVLKVIFFFNIIIVTLFYAWSLWIAQIDINLPVKCRCVWYSILIFF